MEEIMEITLQEQLLIRGATSSEGGALFVVPHAGANGEGAELSLQLCSESPELLGKEIYAEIENFYKTKNRFPFTLATTHGVYALGTTYDEVYSSESNKILSSDKSPSRGKNPIKKISKPTRADVVKNRIAIVTGGAQGIGEGLVRGLVAEGAFVWIADLNKEGAESLAESLNKQYGKTLARGVVVNVTEEGSVAAMIEQVVGSCGGFDLFISNAGVLKAGSVKEMSLQDFSFVTAVDYTGFFICTKFAAQAMSIQNSVAPVDYWSDIIGISSKSGLEGSKKNGAYAGAKFGTLGLTQSFALELVEDRIKVNSICPGNFLDGPLWSDPEKGLFVQYLQTGKVPGATSIADVRSFYESKVPMLRGCETEDLVKAILYTVEQKYETGQAIPVTGGQVMLN